MTQFVKGFENEKLSKDEKRKLMLLGTDICVNNILHKVNFFICSSIYIELYVAASKHKDISSESMDGNGIDRHLFALYVVSIGMSTWNFFLLLLSII